MPRIQTGAVIWYSGFPTRLPIRSFGSRMPRLALTKMHEWRKNRDGKTGMATNGRGSRNSDTRVRGQRHLGDVELAVPQHAEERLLDRQLERVEVDAVGLHPAVGSARVRS